MQVRGLTVKAQFGPWTMCGCAERGLTLQLPTGVPPENLLLLIVHRLALAG